MLLSSGIASANVGSLNFPDAQYEFVSFADLAGWKEDRQAEVFAGFRKSCEVLIRRKDAGSVRPMESALREVCPRALALPERIDDEAAKFYGKFGFIASPLREQQLLLLLKDARRWVR